MVAFFFCLFFGPFASAEEKKVVIGKFSSGHFSDWKEEKFSGKTEYLIVNENGTNVLQGSSKDSASGLGKEKRIDLWQTPILHWRWKIENRLPVRNETTKEGDDYPVRLYVVIDGGLRFWKSKAVNYVWSRGVAKGSAWPNAFAKKNVVMLSLRDATDKTGVWYEEKRNILKDLQKYIDPSIRYIDGIALMTDTDNTNSFANGFYGDIYFTAM
ncbi:MAG: DUF3047 domain-containing protein [Cellvibrionaceae bacterium]